MPMCLHLLSLLSVLAFLLTGLMGTYSTLPMFTIVSVLCGISAQEQWLTGKVHRGDGHLFVVILKTLMNSVRQKIISQTQTTQTRARPCKLTWKGFSVFKFCYCIHSENIEISAMLRVGIFIISSPCTL